jgi:hypothetical protein
MAAVWTRMDIHMGIVTNDNTTRDKKGRDCNRRYTKECRL